MHLRPESNVRTKQHINVISKHVIMPYQNNNRGIAYVDYFGTFFFTLILPLTYSSLCVYIYIILMLLLFVTAGKKIRKKVIQFIIITLNTTFKGKSTGCLVFQISEKISWFSFVCWLSF